MFLPMIISLTSLTKIEFNPNNPVILALLPLKEKLPPSITSFTKIRSNSYLHLKHCMKDYHLLGAHLFTVRAPHLFRVSL